MPVIAKSESKFRQFAALALAAGLLFFFLFWLNGLLFSKLHHSVGVSWVFLPAGLKLLLVLTMGLPGAVGISLAALALGLSGELASNLTTALMASLIAGFAPYLVYKTLARKLELVDGLQKLTASTLLSLSVCFAMVSAALHQVLFSWQALTSQALNDLGAMFIGDMLGTLIVLYAAKLALSVYKSRAAS